MPRNGGESPSGPSRTGATRLAMLGWYGTSRVLLQQVESSSCRKRIMLIKGRYLVGDDVDALLPPRPYWNGIHCGMIRLPSPISLLRTLQMPVPSCEVWAEAPLVAGQELTGCRYRRPRSPQSAPGCRGGTASPLGGRSSRRGSWSRCGRPLGEVRAPRCPASG